MAKTDLNIIKNWFKTGLKPTQAQFWTTWDSFWHKDEKLPISSIENLDNILDNKAENYHHHNEYATNDATSLNEENVSSWRNSLGIKDVEQTDETVKLTQSYEDFGIEAGSSQSLLNQTFASQIFNRVEIPEENADADHVLLADGSTLAKTEFGSNSTVMGIAPDENKNIDISNIAMDWKNPSQKFSGLQDKSNDGTFNELLGKDSNGNLAHVGLNAVTKAMQNSNDAQKDAWRLAQLKSNEGYSTGQPRVDVVVPPFIDKQLGLTYLSIIGLNLYLNNDANSTSRVIFTHVTTREQKIITNFQTTQSNPNIIFLGEDFSIYESGDWEISVENNGLVSQLNTLSNFSIYDNLERLPIPALTWENLGSANSNNTTLSINNDNDVPDTKSSTLITREQANDGVILKFLYEFEHPGPDFSGNPYFLNFGLVNSVKPLQRNILLDHSIGTRGYVIPTYDLAFHPSGKTQSVRSTESTINFFRDTLFIIIKNGVVKMVLQNKGVVDISFITEYVDFSLAGTCNSQVQTVTHDKLNVKLLEILKI